MVNRQGERDAVNASEWSLTQDEDREACQELLQWIADTAGKRLSEVENGVKTVYSKMSQKQECSYRKWLRWCDDRTSYLYMLFPHSKDAERVSLRFYREAKPLESLSLARYSGSKDDFDNAKASAKMLGGSVNSVSYPGKGRLIFNVTTDLGIEIPDTRTTLLTVPSIGRGRTRAISRLDSTALSALIWLHSKAPTSVSRFLISGPTSGHASDTFVRVLGNRKAMYREAYANILGYTEGIARRQRLRTLAISYDASTGNTGDQEDGCGLVKRRIRIRSRQVRRAQLLIGVSWLSGIATIVLSSIYQEELGTDIPAIAIAVVSLNFIIVTQAVVWQMTPEYTVFEVLLGKLSVTPSRRTPLKLHGKDAERYLGMVVAKKRPEVLKKQGACFLKGSCDEGNVQLDGVRMNMAMPGLYRKMNKDWVPVVVFENGSEDGSKDMDEEQGEAGSFRFEYTMLDLTMSSKRSLHFIPAETEEDTAFTSSTWSSPVKAGGLDVAR